MLPGSGGAGDRLYRPVRRGRAGDHLSQRHRQRREPRRPDPGGGPSCPGGGRRPRPSRRGRWGESRRGVHRPDGGRGVQDLPGPPGQRHTGQRGLHPAGLAGGACRSLPPAGRDLPPLPAQRGGGPARLPGRGKPGQHPGPGGSRPGPGPGGAHLGDRRHHPPPHPGHPGQPAGPGGPPGTDLGHPGPQRHGGTDGGGPTPVYRHPPADPPWGAGPG